VLQDVTRGFWTPQEEWSEGQAKKRRKYRPKKDLHELSAQVLMMSISVMLVLAWFQYLKDLPFDQWQLTLSYLVTLRIDRRAQERMLFDPWCGTVVRCAT
jgi:hypothetical protein